MYDLSFTRGNNLFPNCAREMHWSLVRGVETVSSVPQGFLLQSLEGSIRLSQPSSCNPSCDEHPALPQLSQKPTVPAPLAGCLDPGRSNGGSGWHSGSMLCTVTKSDPQGLLFLFGVRSFVAGGACILRADLRLLPHSPTSETLRSVLESAFD